MNCPFIRGLLYINTATSQKNKTTITRKVKYIKDTIPASSVLWHLVSCCCCLCCCCGRWRLVCSCFSQVGDSGSLCHHGDSSLLGGRDLVLFGHLWGGEVEPWGVEAERPRDICLTPYLTFPLGLRRTLWSYLEEACGR